MSLKGNIILSDSYDTIISGANIQVRVEIYNEAQIYFKEIYLTLVGKVQVKWEDMICKNKNGFIVYFMQQFEGKEVLVDKQTTIERNGILTAGCHIFNVIVNIPHKLPHNFVGKSGSVNYELVLLIKDMFAKQKLSTLPLKIERCLDLIPAEFLLPLSAMHNKYFCLRLCNSKPITTKLTLSSASYKPGDIVKYSLLIENCTKYFNVYRISVIISQTQEYKATQPQNRTKKDHCTIYHKTHSLANIQRDQSCIDGTIQLSKSLTPTSLEPCLLMISYKFQVLIIMSGLHTDGYFAVPLIVRQQNIVESNDGEIRLQIEQDLPPKYETLGFSTNNCNKSNVLVETIV